MVSGDTRPRPAPEWISPAPEIFMRSRFGAFAVLKHAAYVRDLRVDGISPAYYEVSDDARRVAFWEHTPETTTLVARRVSSSKSLTKALLERSGIRVPEGGDFDRGRLESGWLLAQRVGLPVVVKPTTGEGGVGVTPKIHDENEFRVAWEAARRASARARIMVERHLPGRDFRLYVVGDRVVAAAWRIPAYVDGDGEASMRVLVARKSQARRANPFLARKAMRVTPSMVRHLAELGLTPESVPELGRRVTLHTIANIGAGGESVDVSERVHPDFQEIAVRACGALPGAATAGVDLLVDDISRSAGAQDWAVCEVNTMPGIAMHHFPASGTPRDAAGALIEHLFPGSRECEPFEQRGVRAVMSGAVTGKGLRRWIWRRAQLRGLTGWVRNRDDDSVEAAFRGAPRAVDDMLRLCHAGHPKAVVEKVTFESWTDSSGDDFELLTAR